MASNGPDDLILNDSTIRRDTEQSQATTRRRRSSAMIRGSLNAVRKSLGVLKNNGPKNDWWNRNRRGAGSGANDEENGFAYQRLITDPGVFKRSINACRFAVFSDVVNGMILQPNYAIMADPEASTESFESTAPFDFASATYFIPMTALLGVAIAGAITGRLSDRVGRKPVLLVCLAGSMLGSAIKWALRGSFWGFCIANFFNGLLSGSLPVALAYVSDVFSTERQKAKQFSYMAASWVLGKSLGGVVAVLMSKHGLFAPLWAGVGIIFVSFLLTLRFLVEPGRIKLPDELGGRNKDETGAGELPTEIDKPTMIHVLIGSFLDIFGSRTLYPLCLAPLAYDTYYKDLIDAGKSPIMSLNAYKWLIVLVSFLVIPAAKLSPRIFIRFGHAAGALFGNFLTGVVTIGLLSINRIHPPTSASFGGFVAVLYIGFPFTVLSQLATSPMLDKLAPANRRGEVQGIFTVLLNFGNAVSPWILGILADSLGSTTTIWIGVGFSFGATIINAPLMLKKIYRPPPRPAKKKRKDDAFDDSTFTLSEAEEGEYIQKALRGDYVPARVIRAINGRRLERGEKFVINHSRSYEKDKEEFDRIRSEALEDFKFFRSQIRKHLARINEPDLPHLIENYNNGMADEMLDIHREVGVWFGDYLNDSGYIGANSPQILKLMILRAFPVVNSEGRRLTVNNCEEVLLNLERLYNRYLAAEMEADEEDQNGLRELLTQRHPPRRHDSMDN